MIGKKRVFHRPRGTTPPPPTQEHVHVRAVLDSGVVVCDDGTMAAAVEVTPVDLSLSDEDAQNALRARFDRFLAGLSHDTPIQIVIATLPQSCQEYRDRIRGRIERYRTLAEEARQAGDEKEYRRLSHMGEVAIAHLSLFEALLEEMKPREEHYLVVVWHNPFPIVGRRREISGDALAKGEKEVLRRRNRIIVGLEGMGLRVAPVDKRGMMQYLYAFYHMAVSPLAQMARPSVLAGVVSPPVLEEAS